MRDSPACEYMRVRTLPLEFAGARPVVEGRINGNPAPMLVDTGSDYTVLLRSAVEKFGLPARRRADMTSVGTNGISDTYDVRVRDFSIGPVAVDSGELIAVWHATRKLPYDALVGADFLLGQDMELHLAQQTMSFHRPKPRLFRPFSCSGAFLAYWDPNASVAELRTMTSDDLRPVVTVRINGVKVRAMIDTGATVSIVSPSAAARAGVTPQSPGVVEGGNFAGIGSGESKSWQATFDSFALGNETVRNARLYVLDMWGAASAESNARSFQDWKRSPPEMVLGIDFLGAHRVLFAMSQQRLYFSYVGGPVLGSKPERSARDDMAGAEAGLTPDS